VRTGSGLDWPPLRDVPRRSCPALPGCPGPRYRCRTEGYLRWAQLRTTLVTDYCEGVADADDVRRIVEKLPHVVEIDSDGFDFRVGNHGFVWSYPERRAGGPRVIRTDIAVLYVDDESEKQALLLGEPDLFFTTPSYEGSPLVMLRLAEVDVDRLTELITDAWRMRAPDDLAGDLD
jgi:hypothetical protein